MTLRKLMASAAKFVVVGLFIRLALSQMGISITPLIAALGGLAVGAGLAIQGPVSNDGAGLVSSLNRMHKIGDTISVCSDSGVMKDITLTTSFLESEDGEQIMILNKQIVGEIQRNAFEHNIVIPLPQREIRILAETGL